MCGVAKRFGDVVAVESVDFDVFPGEIHALVGENGTGKSTLMHILSGTIEPDEGSIYVAGKKVRFETPADALAAGIGMVHQKPLLIDSLSVLDNLRIGTARTERLRRRVEELCAEHSLDIELDTRVERLTDAAREHVALVALLLRDLDIVILD